MFKNFFKKFRVIILAVILLPCVLLLSACSSSSVYIVSIEKTSSSGSTDIYTVTYSNGTTSNLTIENGQDGADLSIESIYNLWLEKNELNDNTENYSKFLSEYLNLTLSSDEEISEQEAINKALLSSVSVYSEFPIGHGPNASVSVGCGAGVVYIMDDDYSYIMTNYHVVYYS